MPKIIAILGPTASGKSGLALEMAKKFNGEIISADSRQIYRKMDVGTAKIAGKKRKGAVIHEGIPHHMISIADPDEEFTLVQYKDMAVKIARDIAKRGKTPFLTGGTGLYISAVIDNLSIPEAAADKSLRREIERDIEEKGLESAWKKLLKLDPDAENTVDGNNPRRVIRALEVCLSTGRPFTKQRSRGKPLFDSLQIGIGMPREKLYERINARVDRMMEIGLLEEAESLAGKYSWNLPALSGIGYRQFRPYFEGRISLEEAVESLKRDTRRYAKRQMTWLGRDKRIRWIESPEEAERAIREFLR